MTHGTHGFHAGLAALTLALFTALAAASSASAQEQTINAFSAWQGEGVVYETGPNTGTFVGSIGGTLYIQTEKGPASGGLIVCPVMLEIDLVDATQVGQGKCTITGEDGAKVYAEWTCQGVHLIGCDGEFKLTGGTERMAGISGAGALMVRTTTRVASLEMAADGTAPEIGSGLLLLNELTISLPKQ